MYKHKQLKILHVITFILVICLMLLTLMIRFGI
jgi:hypothetical protein